MLQVLLLSICKLLTAFLPLHVTLSIIALSRSRRKINDFLQTQEWEGCKLSQVANPS